MKGGYGFRRFNCNMELIQDYVIHCNDIHDSQDIFV